MQILARGDLSAKERDALVNTAETSILPVDGVQDFYARSFRPGSGGHQVPRDSIGTIRTVFADWDERDPAATLMDACAG
ncbi:MAG: hypothetical protein CM15mP115_06600 [Alphaproteobacteria bacterium]|nr:MAG: hypothetical protein CM15mP115_06600 [Alphaproteobacteria bacterium]